MPAIRDFPHVQDELHYWIEPDGTEHPLQWLAGGANDVTVVFGASGLDMPPIVQSTHDTPYTDGTLTTMIRMGARTISMPFEITGSNFVSVSRTLRDFVVWMRPRYDSTTNTYLTGQYKIVRTDGQQRVLNCYYLKGLEGDNPIEYGGGCFARRMVDFYADDPFWYDPALSPAQSVTGVSGTGTNSNATFGVVASMTNNSDVTVWPVWTFTIPRSRTSQWNGTDINFGVTARTINFSAILTDTTTGDYFDLTLPTTFPAASLSGTTPLTQNVTDVIRIVDTRPQKRIATDDSGNIAPLAYANFFSLAVGTHSIFFRVSTPTPRVSGETNNVNETFSVNAARVDMQYQPAYLSV